MYNKLWLENTITKLKHFYSKKGKKWCVDNLKLKESQVRHITSKNKIRQDKKGEFFKEWQLRAAKSKIGKKASLETRKKLSIIQRSLHPKTIFKKQCIICGKEFIVMGTQGKWHKRLTCGNEKCISLLRKFVSKDKWLHKKHPKGFLGHKHSVKSRNIMSEKSIANWKNPNSIVNSYKFRQNKSDYMSKFMIDRLKNNSNMYSKTKKGWEIIGNKKNFYRSGWEVVYARYLQWLKEKKQIKDWKYENKTFWFEKIRRGVRSYTPDFEIINNDNNIEYHEVKGWMDDKSKTKLKRMKKYYPNIKIILIDEYAFKEIKKWERLFS